MFGEVGMIHRKFYSILNVSWRMSSLALIIHRDRAPAWRDVSAALRILVLGAYMKVARLAVRAENPIRGCEQQSCDADGPAVMITDHVPAVRFPPDHAGDHVATAVPARGCVEDGRDPDPAPPGRGPAAAAAAPPEAEMGGPGRARGIGRG